MNQIAARPDWFRRIPPAFQVRIANRCIRPGAAAGGGDVLAFAHGHILRAVAVAWLALDITAASEFRLDVATLSQLAATDRGRELALWNSQ